MDEIIKFLIETDPQTHFEIVSGIDFVSMELANKGNSFARKIYYKTKKDVIEFKRKKPWEALIDKEVQEFVSKHYTEVWNEFNGIREKLKKYIALCLEKT